MALGDRRGRVAVAGAVQAPAVADETPRRLELERSDRAIRGDIMTTLRIR